MATGSVISKVEWWRESVPLTRPYTIAFATRDAVDLVFVRIESASGAIGLGSAAAVPDITGEDVDDCTRALEVNLESLVGRDPRHLGSGSGWAATALADTPAARAAVDMALYDLFGHTVGVSVVDLLGRCHDALPTSITIGIKSTAEAIEEAREYIGRGFRHLKAKTGHDIDEDESRLEALRAAVGPDIHIRIDGNQGYDVATSRSLGPLASRLDLELVEQPMPRGTESDMRRLDSSLRARIAADESAHDAVDVFGLATPSSDGTPACGIVNIKLMKCGGITAALAIARIAEAASIDLMWGCMDESRISIAAALHAAFACPRTRYLDLDGSFDLARDPAIGGFTIEDGIMRPTGGPGLGVSITS